METNDRNKMHLTGKPSRRRASGDNGPKREEKIQIQYTPAKPFNRTRFLLHLATVVAVVLAVLLGMSIFFKTRQVQVSGAEKYSAWEVREAAGIQDNDSLLGLSRAKISVRIRQALPYVGNVRVGIKLPDTVIISITELEVVYAIEDNVGGWWLMDASGRIVDTTNVATAKTYTRIIGVQISDAVIGEQAVAARVELPTEENTGNTETTGEPQPPAVEIPTGEMLAAAVEIATTLEKYGIMGNIATIDVTDLEQLTVWYEKRFEINFGSTDRLDYKVRTLKSAINKMGEYQTGYMDASYTTWPDEIYVRPFDTNS